MLAETFTELVTDPAHWQFEIFTLIVLDGLFLGLAYPLFRRWLKAHDAKHHPKNDCCDNE